MTPIQEWVRALQSGEYKQVNSTLRGFIEQDTVTPYFIDAELDKGNVGYCCLGVACELAPFGKWEGTTMFVNEREGEYNDQESSTGRLTHSMEEWLGVKDNETSEYIELNDAEKLSFKQIADRIILKHPDEFHPLVVWVAALESGLYEQGNGGLCRVDGDELHYCCLGVACDVFPEGDWEGTTHVENEPVWKEFKIDKDSVGHTGALPIAISSKFDLNSEQEHTLIRMNDKDKATFEEIAAQLREWFPDLFTV